LLRINIQTISRPAAIFQETSGSSPALQGHGAAPSPLPGPPSPAITGEDRSPGAQLRWFSCPHANVNRENLQRVSEWGSAPFQRWESRFPAAPAGGPGPWGPAEAERGARVTPFPPKCCSISPGTAAPTAAACGVSHRADTSARNVLLRKGGETQADYASLIYMLSLEKRNAWLCLRQFHALVESIAVSCRADTGPPGPLSARPELFAPPRVTWAAWFKASCLCFCASEARNGERWKGVCRERLNAIYLLSGQLNGQL